MHGAGEPRPRRRGGRLATTGVPVRHLVKAASSRIQELPQFYGKVPDGSCRRQELARTRSGPRAHCVDCPYWGACAGEHQHSWPRLGTRRAGANSPPTSKFFSRRISALFGAWFAPAPGPAMTAAPGQRRAGFRRISSKDTPPWISVRTIAARFTSKTPRSVMKMTTHFRLWEARTGGIFGLSVLGAVFHYRHPLHPAKVHGAAGP